MAFGTGTHETTQMALRSLELSLRAGDEVLDVGTGSGILSIAAAKLGAGNVVAVDTDPLAVENARENLVLNQVEGRVDLREGSASDVAHSFDLVVANISSGVLIGMLRTLWARLKPLGALILGGVLRREEPAFLEVVGRETGLQVGAVDRRGEWVCVTATREAGAHP